MTIEDDKKNTRFTFIGRLLTLLSNRREGYFTVGDGRCRLDHNGVLLPNIGILAAEGFVGDRSAFLYQQFTGRDDDTFAILSRGRVSLDVLSLGAVLQGAAVALRCRIGGGHQSRVRHIYFPQLKSQKLISSRHQTVRR